MASTETPSLADLAQEIKDRDVRGWPKIVVKARSGETTVSLQSSTQKKQSLPPSKARSPRP
jgi:hypothetical protein